MPNNGPNAEWSLSGMHRSVPSLNSKTDSALDSAEESNSHSNSNSRLGLSSGIPYTTNDESNWQFSVSSNQDSEDELLESVDSSVVIIQSTAQPVDGSGDIVDSGLDKNEHQPTTFGDGDNDSPSATSERSKQASTSPEEGESIADIPDDVVIGQLSERNYSVVPGEETEFDILLLNNGPQIALFSPQLIGSIPDQWATITPSHTRLHPGEQTTFRVSIKPPCESTIRSGSYPLAVELRTGGPNGRYCQLGFHLQIEPYSDVQIGTLQPKKMRLSWRQPSSTAILPVTNSGNVPAEIRLQGYDSQHACTFDFSLGRRGQMFPSGTANQTGRENFGHPAHIHRAMPHISAGENQFSLLPGQTEYVPIAVTYRNPHLFALRQKSVRFGITVYARAAQADEQGTRPIQSTHHPSEQGQHPAAAWTPQANAPARLLFRPLIGPGTVLGVAGIGILGILGVTVTLLLLMLSLYPKAQSNQVVPIALASSPNKAALEIIVKVNEVVPSASKLADNQTQFVESGEGSSPSDTGIQEMALASVAEAVPTAIIVQALPIVGNDAQDASALDVQQQGNESQAGVIQPSPEERNTNTINAVGGNGVPLVQASMISSPDEVGQFREAGATNRQGQASEQVVTVDGAERSPSAPAGGAINTDSMTYEQMFQLVASQYDLDWRRLAAQAYVESSFNPLALGKRGDLGLMQILPSTWQEWAPRVDAQDPFDSYSNVLVAALYTDYLRSLLQSKGIPEEEWVLVAYNWGPNRVIDFMEAGGNWEALSVQRKKYAEDIIRIANSLPQN